MKSLFLLGLFVYVISCAVVHKAHPCNFKENCAIHDFKLASRVATSHYHQISIHLKQNDFADNCPSMLNDVSNPKSPKYGHYLNFDEIRSLTWNQKAIDAVKSYLSDHGIPSKQQEVAPNGEFIRVKAAIGQIEKMFSAKFFHFESVGRQISLVRSPAYTIPSHLSDHITVINGIRNFPMYSKHTMIGARIRADPPSGSVTPQLIWSTYNMPNETDSTPLADQSVFESLGQSYSPDDLTKFQETYNLPVQGVAEVIGTNDPSTCVTNPDNCGEANLDVQYIMAMAQGSPTIYWSIDQSVGDIFLDFIEEVAKDPQPPQVFSISYGGPEHLQNQDDVILFNTETCKMGLRGITLFVSSGDDGVAGSEARSDPSQCAFIPQYPADCPYVTTVGATLGPESGNPETACMSNNGSIITTGGGFSNLFSRPSWQENSVRDFLRSGNVPPTNMFNTTGRAYPDVSALGNAYHVVIGGNDYQVSGTSASAPVFCAMVTLVNGDREVNGKKPLGFLNPLLYQLDPSIFNDITIGENNCCASGQSAPVCCPYGFSCTRGWDPVTGLGSINFAKFADYLASRP